MKKIVIFGCGGHAASVMDAIKSNKEYIVAGFIDRTISNYMHEDVSVIATDDSLDCVRDEGIDLAAIGIGSVKGNDVVRARVFEKAIGEGLTFPVIKDATAIVSTSAEIEDGSFVGKGAIINSSANIGKCCIINSGAIIEHNVEVGDFSHISVGSVICGDVKIGCNCMIGANATIIQGIKIGNNVTVGAGAVVINDVEDGKTVVGNPAKIIEIND